jgi:hypothetical protein
MSKQDNSVLKVGDEVISVVTNRSGKILSIKDDTFCIVDFNGDRKGTKVRIENLKKYQ